MQVSISDPTYQTLLFALALCALFLLSLVPKKHYTPHALTQELKGFAILAIIFAHIGYYLSADPRFLFPLSILAGVGVNLFFFLSGYGLTFSQMKKDEHTLVFYKRRLLRLFVPFWIVLAIVFVLDAAVLGKAYPVLYVLRAFAGIFNSADLFADVNSPLWYFTLILLYYLLFPLVFNKKRPWITAALLYVSVFALIKINFPFLFGVIGLYQVHMIAFPFGVFVAWLFSSQKNLIDRLKDIYTRYARLAYVPFMLLLIAVVAYFSIHSNVGGSSNAEQFTSLLTMSAVGLIFYFKKRESKLLSLFGLYSYEIYLFHWPLMYRYDVLYKHLPASVATLGYLAVFVGTALLLKKYSASVFKLNMVPSHNRD